MSHTPGPWVADDRQIINPNAILRDLRVVAEIYADDAEGSNTRLIAAAPELLAALKDVLRIAKAASLGVTGNAPRIEQASAAIAKAEGK